MKRLALLVAELESDRAALDRSLDRIAALDLAGADLERLTFAAWTLHQTFGAVEAMLYRTVRALEGAAAASDDGLPKPGAAATDLFITPGYEFRVVDALLTNFHLPRSTLIALVGAFAGLDHVLAAYREAVEARYRFYSYGDAMFLA